MLHNILITWGLLKYIWYDSLITILSGGIETNPGSTQGFKIFHWNLNSLSPHIYKKVSLLWAFISVQKLTITYPCLSETYLKTLKRHLMTII